MMFSQKKTTNRIWPRALIVQLVSSLIVFVSTGELNFSSMYLCCGLNVNLYKHANRVEIKLQICGCVFWNLSRDDGSFYTRGVWSNRSSHLLSHHYYISLAHSLSKGGTSKWGSLLPPSIQKERKMISARNLLGICITF